MASLNPKCKCECLNSYISGTLFLENSLNKTCCLYSNRMPVMMPYQQGWGTLLSTVNGKTFGLAGKAEGRKGKKSFSTVFKRVADRWRVLEHFSIKVISTALPVVVAEREMVAAAHTARCGSVNADSLRGVPNSFYITSCILRYGISERQNFNWKWLLEQTQLRRN